MPGLFKSGSVSGAGPKGGQSIRGRISGPIPIPNPLEEEEFPIRNPGTGIATPLGNEGREKQLQMPSPEQSSTVVVPGNAPPAPPDSARDTKTDSVAQSGSSPVSGGSGSPAQRRTKPTPSTLRYSTASAGTGTATHQSRDAPQRKKSTLRTALGKLFGRKKKTGSDTSTISETNVTGVGSPAQHRSNPSSFSRTLKENEPKRSASLPITEYDRALRSHSVGPEDIVAIESARNSIAEPNFHRKRATTLSTSRLYSGSGAREFGGGLGGLSPRPASTHGRGSHVLVSSEDPEAIGMAITSDSMGQRRRSRSLSQLHDLTEGQQQGRRRSDEIRYWRESYDPGFMSPTSSGPNDDTGVIDLEMPPEVPQIQDTPKTPPQPFNFGTVENMKELVGAKISDQVGLEERVSLLEARSVKVEQLVNQLLQGVPSIRPFPDTPERAPPPIPTSELSTTYLQSSGALNPSIYQTISNDRQASSRYSASRGSDDTHGSFGEAPTFVGSIPPSQPAAHRPTSTATVRGATSLPTLPRETNGPFTADHYTTLLALLDTERAARQALEAQVTKMSHKLDLVSRMSGQPRLDTGPPTGTYSAFEHDDDDEPTSALAGDDDYSESEAFKTPREEQPHPSFGAFGEELRDDDDDPARKKAARTLSLSQLTLGKPPKKKTSNGVNL